MKISVALGATLFCLACVGAAFARGRVNVAGEWTAQAQGMIQQETCKVTLSSNTMFGQHQASSFGCSGALMQLNKWSIQGRKVVLSDPFGKVLAQLTLRGQRMVGKDAKGQRVELYRPGSAAATSVPQSGRNGWSLFGGRRARRHAAKGNCVVYPYTTRCVRRGEMRLPKSGDKVTFLTDTNMRLMQATDGMVVGVARHGVCAQVQHCSTQNGKAWCYVLDHGKSGFVRQTFPINGRRSLLFRKGCGR